MISSINVRFTENVTNLINRFARLIFTHLWTVLFLRNTQVSAEAQHPVPVVDPHL